MWKIQKVVLVLAAAGTFVAQAQASDSHLQGVPDQQAVRFSRDDIDAMFDRPDKSLQLAALSKQEMRETEGAWVWWAVGGAVGGVMNTAGYIGSNEDWTYGNAAYSFLSGAAGGLVATLPGGSAMRVGYGVLGTYTAMQPWGGYNWSRW